MKKWIKTYVISVVLMSFLTGCVVYQPRPCVYASPGYVVYEEPAVVYVHGGYYHRGYWR